MKRVRVIDTSGAALDWLVAKASGRLDQRVQPDPRPGISAVDIGVSDGKVLVFDLDKLDYAPFRPSTDPAQAVPIIDREGIGFFCNLTADRAARFRDASPDWRAFAYNKHHTHYYGPTPLVAAMRCYATSKLGDEVEVPEELL